MRNPQPHRDRDQAAQDDQHGDVRLLPLGDAAGRGRVPAPGRHARVELEAALCRRDCVRPLGSLSRPWPCAPTRRVSADRSAPRRSACASRPAGSARCTRSRSRRPVRPSQPTCSRPTRTTTSRRSSRSTGSTSVFLPRSLRFLRRGAETDGSRARSQAKAITHSNALQDHEEGHESRLRPEFQKAWQRDIAAWRTAWPGISAAVSASAVSLLRTRPLTRSASPRPRRSPHPPHRAAQHDDPHVHLAALQRPDRARPRGVPRLGEGDGKDGRQLARRQHPVDQQHPHRQHCVRRMCSLEELGLVGSGVTDRVSLRRYAATLLLRVRLFPDPPSCSHSVC